MANEGAGAGADASGAGGASGGDTSGAGTQAGATGGQGGADASKSVDYWKVEAKNAFGARDAEKAARSAAEQERDLLKARIAELEKAGAQGSTSGGSNTSAGAAGAGTFDPKAAAELAGTAGKTAGEAAAQARLDAYIAAQNRQKLDDQVISAFKAAGGQYEALMTPLLDQAVKDGKVAIDAAGRVVTGHEGFIAGLRTAYPMLFGPTQSGTLPGGAGSAVINDAVKAMGGRRGSLATGPVLDHQTRRSVEQATRNRGK